MISLPNRHPALVAGEAAQFDHMSRGRFIFGIGTGSLISDFELLGNGDPALRNRMLIELIDMIEKIWSQDPPYDIEGEFWTTKIERTVNRSLGIGFIPKPYQQPRPPICVTAASPNSQTVRIAGPARLGPDLERVPHRRGRRHALGHAAQGRGRGRARAARRRVARRAHASMSPRAMPRRTSACMSAQSSYRHYFAYFREILGGLGRLVALKARPDMRDDEVTVENILESRLIYGSPQTVLDKLVAFRDKAGPFGSLLFTGVDWTGPNEAWERESMRRLAEEVMPRLAQHAAAKAAE